MSEGRAPDSWRVKMGVARRCRIGYDRHNDSCSLGMPALAPRAACGAGGGARGQRDGRRRHHHLQRRRGRDEHGGHRQAADHAGGHGLLRRRPEPRRHGHRVRRAGVPADAAGPRPPEGLPLHRHPPHPRHLAGGEPRRRQRHRRHQRRRERAAGTINGGTGDDTLVGGQENDTFRGGAGTDSVAYVGIAAASITRTVPVTAALPTGASPSTGNGQAGENDASPPTSRASPAATATTP